MRRSWSFPDVAAALDHYRDVLGFEVAAYELVPEDNGHGHCATA